MLVKSIRPNFKKDGWHRAMTWFALVIFVFASTPIPVVLHATKISQTDESDVPYPCQGGTCGCTSARKCWTSCCCLSPKQRAAWAKRNGVKPPDYAVVESTEEHESEANESLSCDRGEVSEPKPLRACCKKQTKQNTKETLLSGVSECVRMFAIKPTASEKNCCSSKVARISKDDVETSEVNAPKEAPELEKVTTIEEGFEKTQSQSKLQSRRTNSRVLTAFDVAKCNGLTFDLSSLSVCLLPLSVVIPKIELRSFDDSNSNEIRIDIDMDVPTPPPRSIVA